MSRTYLISTSYLDCGASLVENLNLEQLGMALLLEAGIESFSSMLSLGIGDRETWQRQLVAHALRNSTSTFASRLMAA
jgi:hypothetical protein